MIINRLSTWLSGRRGHPALTIHRASSLMEYREHVAKMATVHRERWLQELSLCEGQLPFATAGRCYPCQRDVEFNTDFEYSSAIVNGKRVPNWRERVLCPCLLNNRTRASIQILEETLGAGPRDLVYLAEQITPLYETLKTRFPKLVGSEYLGESIPFGSLDERGIRNESIAKLTFDDASFDYVLNFDVLEHIPTPERGLAEMYRVLRPGGKVLLSVPFLPAQQETVTRARLLPGGEIEHLLDPQYHGDPISSEGCLCFQDFGWELLDSMRETGFSRVEMLLYWSDTYGYYGVEQMVIAATK